ncbi:MAG: cytochrome c maturation protein CcmE [Rhodospirillaceae bacterium]|nr:cytochrome c maturation protein CcmE [Rhodospirillaceae bacterium]
MRRKHQRTALLAMAVIGIGTAAALTLAALQDNLLFFYGPGEIEAQHLVAGQRFRLGGLVVDGSIRRLDDGLTITFDVTDTVETVSVVYVGPVPDLFAEGQGVIANGMLDRDGVFQADELLAKHDENYMPPEVAERLERAGHPTQ